MAPTKLYFRVICIDARERTVTERSLSWAQVDDFMRGSLEQADLQLDALGVDILLVGEKGKVTSEAGFIYRNHKGSHPFVGNGLVLGARWTDDGRLAGFDDSRLPLSLAIRNVSFSFVKRRGGADDTRR